MGKTKKAQIEERLLNEASAEMVTNSMYQLVSSVDSENEVYLKNALHAAYLVTNILHQSYDNIEPAGMFGSMVFRRYPNEIPVVQKKER